MTSCRAWPGSQETRPSQLRGPAGPGSRRDSQEPPSFTRAPASEGPGRSISAETTRPQHTHTHTPSLEGAWGGSGGAGWGRGELKGRGGDLCPPDLSHQRVRRDIPPARTAPRSPARRLSPEREPGRGQDPGCSGRSGPRAALGGVSVSAGPALPARRNCSRCRRGLKHFSISRQARRRRPGLARGRRGRGLWGGGAGGAGPAGRHLPKPSRACCRTGLAAATSELRSRP